MQKRTDRGFWLAALAILAVFTATYMAVSFLILPFMKMRTRERLNGAYQVLKDMEPEDYYSQGEEDAGQEEELEGVSFVICDGDFQLVSENLNAENAERMRRRMERMEDRFSEDAQAQFFPDWNGEPIAVLGKTQTEEGLYYMYLYRNMRTLRRNLVFASRTLAVVLPLLYLIILLGMAFFFRGNRRSLASLERELSLLSEGDYTARIRPDEITEDWSDISEQVNHLAENLYRRESELKNYSYLADQNLSNRSQLDTMQKELVSRITHQLKTPLAIISSQLELDHEETDPRKKEYYYHSVMDEIDKMSLLISDILRNGKREHEEAAVRLRRVSLSELLQELIPKYENWLQYNGIRFRAEVEENIEVLADPVQLEQVVHNYMINAVKHTRRGKEIFLQLVRGAENCELSVHNEGDGVPEGDLAEIWKDYVQAEGGDQGMEVGMGLYIVKDIVLRHKGEYGVQNDETGVKFYILLPLL